MRFYREGERVEGKIDLHSANQNAGQVVYREGWRSDIPEKFINTNFTAGFLINLFNDDGTIEAVFAIFGGQVA